MVDSNPKFMIFDLMIINIIPRGASGLTLNILDLILKKKTFF